MLCLCCNRVICRVVCWRQWTWSKDDPEAITDEFSGTRFPNAAYQTSKRTVRSASGVDVTLTYTKGKHPTGAPSKKCARSNNPTKYYCEPAYNYGIWLEGCLAELQLPFFYRTILQGLANQYSSSNAATEVYAERVLQLLDAWAAVWPTYVFRVCNTGVVMTPDECNAYRGSGSTVACSIFSHYNGPAHELDYVPYAVYAKVASSKHAKRLSDQRGYDVLARIRANILKREADYFLPGGGGMPLSVLVLGNLIGWAPHLIQIGTILQDGKYARFLIDYLSGATGQAGRDGMVMESFMYLRKRGKIYRVGNLP